VLIDATMKEDFPPISLPKREYMERAKKIWEELGLPKLKPESPWFGYSLGEWPDELERAAELAVNGDYFETGELLAKRRRKDVRMNTEVRDLQEPGGETDLRGRRAGTNWVVRRDPCDVCAPLLSSNPKTGSGFFLI